MKRIFFALGSIFILLPVYASAGFLLGVGTHIYEPNTDNSAQVVKSIGLNSIRDDFVWNRVEKEKGNLVIPQRLDQYIQKASESNISPLMVLVSGNPLYDGGKKPFSPGGISAYARYAGFSANKLQGQVNLFEIWNEWDNSAEPVSAESYFELVKATAPAIKAVNKDAIVLAGAATSSAMRNGWVERLVRLGVLSYVDGISLHPYVHCERDNRPEAFFNFVAELSAKLKKANGGKEVPLYITEMGWPSHKGACGTAPEKVGQYLARALLLVRTLPEVKGFWWYDLKNDGKKIEEREHNFGLLDYDYGPKPALHSLRDITPVILKGQTFTRLSAPAGLVMVAVTDNQGKKTFAIWSENGDDIKAVISIVPDRGAFPSARKIGSGKAGQASKLTISSTPLVLKGRQSLKIGAEQSTQDSNPLTENKDKIALTIDGTPQLLTGVQSLTIK